MNDVSLLPSNDQTLSQSVPGMDAAISLAAFGSRAWAAVIVPKNLVFSIQLPACVGLHVVLGSSTNTCSSAPPDQSHNLTHPLSLERENIFLPPTVFMLHFHRH
ncbi:unnamed protein product [Pleuronectes platessa]|uniref:Uncharacterized protein n=1 Tax=Pleuronectes platessa TaxID=8262 RepID=A0A9N7Y4Q1_PLEPL|nr:unnamed protein product [Pleuronectes platessa]